MRPTPIYQWKENHSSAAACWQARRYLQHQLAKINLSAKRGHFRLLRHATIMVNLNGLNVLVDPMLSKKDAMDPVANASNTIRIPMVELPVSDSELGELIRETDAVTLTHLHRDHWDERARQLIPKTLTIFCQPADEKAVREQGFSNVLPIDNSLEWKGIMTSRTGGQHGTGEIGKKMGSVSGFVLQHAKETIYVAGDTIYCPEVQKAISEHRLTVTIVNGGAAQFLQGDPITMDLKDIIRTRKEIAKSSRLYVVHMDTVNHCHLTREKLREGLKAAGELNGIGIPMDGEKTVF